MMTTTTLARTAARSATLNGITSILSTVTIAMYFTVGGAWGPINDGNSVIWMLSFIPIALFFYALLRERHAIAVTVVTLIGVACASLFAALQLALTLGLVEFGQTFQTVTLLSTGVGLWLVISGLLLRKESIFPDRVVILTLLLGVGYLLGGIGFTMAGWEHPLALGGFAATALLGPVWAFLLARTLSAPNAIGAVQA